MSNSFREILRIGRKVDPIILKAVSRNTPASLVPLVRYHFDGGGKRMRAALVVLSCGAAGGKASDALLPAAVVEMIHNYSLVMDDLIDRGEVRRGKPTARVRFGDSTSLLVAMYYREVLDEIIEECLQSSDIRKVAIQAMKDIIDGERLDLLFQQAGDDEPYLVKNRLKRPNIQRYLQMVGKKTAALFSAATEIGGIAAGANDTVLQKLRGFGWKAGLAFQIMDDVLDIVGDKTGKQRGKDIIEHKLGNATTLTALQYLTATKRGELLEILRGHSTPPSSVAKAMKLVMGTPAESVCREVARVYLEDARRDLHRLRPSPYLAPLNAFCDLIAARAY